MYIGLHALEPQITLAVYPRTADRVAESGQWLVMEHYLRKPLLYPAELRDRCAGLAAAERAF